jgi:hypothetical protein
MAMLYSPQQRSQNVFTPPPGRPMGSRAAQYPPSRRPPVPMSIAPCTITTTVSTSSARCVGNASSGPSWGTSTVFGITPFGTTPMARVAMCGTGMSIRARQKSPDRALVSRRGRCQCCPGSWKTWILITRPRSNDQNSVWREPQRSASYFTSEHCFWSHDGYNRDSNPRVG